MGIITHVRYACSTRASDAYKKFVSHIRSQKNEIDLFIRDMENLGKVKSFVLGDKTCISHYKVHFLYDSVYEGRDGSIRNCFGGIWTPGDTTNLVLVISKDDYTGEVTPDEKLEMDHFVDIIFPEGKYLPY